MQRFLPPLLAFVFVGTLFSLFWAMEGPPGKIQSGFPKPDDPEYAAFYHNYQAFYGERNEGRRERLRQIQKRLEADPESLILKKELATYHAWIKTVPEKRNEINRTTTIEDCLEVIRSIKEEQDRKQANSNPAAKNRYPSIYELAEYLEDIELVNLARLSTLLGHTPGNFRVQLEKDYCAEVE